MHSNRPEPTFNRVDWLQVYQQLAQQGRRPVLAEPHQRVLLRVAQQVQGRQHELEDQLRASGADVVFEDLSDLERVLKVLERAES